MRPLEQLLVTNREEWAAQRRKHRQFIVRPLDGGERGAQGLDFLALVERSPADEHVGYAASLERLDVGTRHVGLPAHEAPEQQADVLGRDVDRRAAAPLGDLPLAVVDDPVDEGADCAGQRLFDRAAGHVAAARTVRARAARRSTAVRRALTGAARAGRSRPAASRSSPVMTGANAAFTNDWISGTLRKLVVKCTSGRPSPGRAGRPRDRSRHRRGGSGRSTAWDRRPGRAGPATVVPCASRSRSGSSAAEEQEDLRLQRVGILELVDEDPLEAILKALADAAVVAHQVARDEQQVEKVERAALRLHLPVPIERAAQFLLQAVRRDRRRQPSGTDRVARAGRRVPLETRSRAMPSRRRRRAPA